MFLQQPTASAAQKQLLGKRRVGVMDPTISSKLTASKFFTFLKILFVPCISSARAKRMFHVCLGVSHERECFQEIAAGLSYKAVKLL